MQNEQKGFPFIIIISSLLILFVLSLVPWGKITSGKIKDFDLFSDLLTDSASMSAASVAEGEVVDPEYLQALVDTSADSAMVITADSLADAISENDACPGRVDGNMIIEDYTPGRAGLKHLKSALANGSARIAIIGDSYIEGDIFSQDIRRQLQDAYGGRGVGYMPATSQVNGFRRTVNHSFSGFEQQPIQKASKSKYFTIMGEYFVGQPGAVVTYKGTKDSKLAKWNDSEVLFIAPEFGSITLYIDSDTLSVNVQAGPEVQSLSIKGETSMFKIKSDVPGLIFLGAYISDESGVKLDCMSIRGDSGITHSKINADLAEEMRKFVDYDLIIVEYGINALSSEQTNYSKYGELMTKVVDRLREAYPNADILMLGIGDRGQKISGQVHSLPTAPNMVNAQRQAAKNAGCLFWDTREAMGGDDAIVDWRERKLVNADYIHLNSAGGKELATLLVNSLKASIGE